VVKITGEYEAMLNLIVEIMEQTWLDLLNLMLSDGSATYKEWTAERVKRLLE